MRPPAQVGCRRRIPSGAVPKCPPCGEHSHHALPPLDSRRAGLRLVNAMGGLWKSLVFQLCNQCCDENRLSQFKIFWQVAKEFLDSSKAAQSHLHVSFQKIRRVSWERVCDSAASMRVSKSSTRCLTLRPNSVRYILPN